MHAKTPTPGTLPSDSPRLATFKSDLLASFVVFLVALPLCIGIAVAVGVSPARALITGIIGGLIVGIFSGSPLQVSGPAAGLFVIIADLIAQSRTEYITTSPLTGDALNTAATEYSLTVLGASVFFAGLIQIAAGRLRLGQWFRAVSPSVIKGMLAGIGILILTSQFHVMLDHVAMWKGHNAHGAFEYIATIPEAVLKCFSADTSANHHLAALTGIIAICCFIGWSHVAPKRLKFLPAALVGIATATLFATGMNLEVQLLKVPDNMFSEVTWPTLQWSQLLTDGVVVTGALVIALVASAETLLCATAVDQMHQGPRTKYDQELTAQGIGNVLCGLVGALPMTGVIVRSSANVSAGAKTRLSTVLHGMWLLIFVAVLPFVLNYIPRSALGALLVYTGFRLVKIEDIKSLWHSSRSEAGIYCATVVTILGTDLLLGVVTGIVLSALKLLLRFSNLHITTELEDDGTTNMHLRGAATFLCLPKLARHLEKVNPGSDLRVHYEHLSYIDHACLDLLRNQANQHANFGGKIILNWNELHERFTDTRPPLILRTGGRANENTTDHTNELTP